MRCYDINYVDDHVCATNPSQKVLDSWERIKKDAAEALNPSHNQLKPKMPGVNIVETFVINKHADASINEREKIARIAREVYEYLAEHFGH